MNDEAVAYAGVLKLKVAAYYAALGAPDIV
jgi:hypothetical protein